MNNEQVFIDLVAKLEKQLHFKKDTFTLKKDDRIRGLFVTLYNYIDGNKENCYMITYNSKKLNNKIEILMGILHEMGHVRRSHLTTNNHLSILEMEYQAESFALDAIKKYYNKHYLRAIDILTHYINGPDELYSVAFSKLYDERVSELNEKKRLQKT